MTVLVVTGGATVFVLLCVWLYRKPKR